MPFPFGGLLVPGAVPFGYVSASQQGGSVLGQPNGAGSVTITANGIIGPVSVAIAPGSTGPAGTIGAITSTTFVWNPPDRTSVGPGSYTVRFTCAGQSFDFSYLVVLSPPEVLSINPASGPATRSVPSPLTVACRGVPPPGLGVPMQLLIGTGVSSSETPIAPAAFTCGMSPTGSGPLTVTPIIDGIAGTPVAGLYTGNPPPIQTGTVAVGTIGGDVNVPGENFVNGITAKIVIGGTPTLVSSSWQSANLVVVTVPAGLPLGDNELILQNPDLQISDRADGINVVTTDNLEIIFGANIIQDLHLPTANHTGTNVTSIHDDSGAGNTGQVRGSPPPQWNAVDPNNDYGGGPSVSFDGVQNGIFTSPISFTGSTLYFLFAGRITQPTFNNTHCIASIISRAASKGPLLVGANANAAQLIYTSAPSATWGSPVNTSTTLMCAGTVSAAGSNALSINVDNGTDVTATKTDTIPASPGDIAWMCHVSTSGTVFDEFTAGTAVAFALLTVKPTSSQLTRAYTFLNLRDHVLPDIVVTSATDVPVSTPWTTRILGENFPLAGLQMFVMVAGVQTPLVVDSNTATFADVETPSLPAGQYDITASNGLGNVTTKFGILNVTAAVNPFTIAGTAVVGMYEPPSVQFSGSNVTSRTDLSGVGNSQTIVSATPPTWNPATNEITYDGSIPTYLGCALFDVRVASPGWTIVEVIKPTNNTGTQSLGGYNNFTANLNINLGKPRMQAGTSWGVTISGAQHIVIGTIAAGVNPADTIQVDSSPKVGGTLSQSAIAPGSWFYSGARWSGSVIVSPYTGTEKATYVFNTVLTDPQVAALISYIQAQAWF